MFHAERTKVIAETNPSELLGTDKWRLWTVDLATGAGAPLEGVDWNSGAISTYDVDGHSVPGAEWAVTRIHEMRDGRAAHAFDVPG